MKVCLRYREFVSLRFYKVSWVGQKMGSGCTPPPVASLIRLVDLWTGQDSLGIPRKSCYVAVNIIWGIKSICNYEGEWFRVVKVYLIPAMKVHFHLQRFVWTKVRFNEGLVLAMKVYSQLRMCISGGMKVYFHLWRFIYRYEGLFEQLCIPVMKGYS